jgi:hypothetical protein
MSYWYNKRVPDKLELVAMEGRERKINLCPLGKRMDRFRDKNIAVTIEQPRMTWGQWASRWDRVQGRYVASPPRPPHKWAQFHIIVERIFEEDYHG